MHPPLYPFGDSARWKACCRYCLSWDDQKLSTAEALLSNHRIPVLQGSEIGTYLGISPKLVTRMAVASHKYYRTFCISKKSGGTRQIAAPRVFLKVVQRYILDCILVPVPTSSAVVGFVRGRALADGARAHQRARFLWNIDLQDFFPSIAEAQVCEAFRSLLYPDTAARFLARICTLQGRLPQGAPTSPMLANIVFQAVDRKLEQYSQASSIVYTRYADDLSFSSDAPIPLDFRNAVSMAVQDAGYHINPAKIRLMGPQCQRKVTGLVINAQVSVPREYRRKLRAICHRAKVTPQSTTVTSDQLHGMLAYVGQFHPEEVSRYREDLGL